MIRLNELQAKSVSKKKCLDFVRFYIKPAPIKHKEEVLLSPRGRPIHKAFPRLLHQPTDIAWNWAEDWVWSGGSWSSSDGKRKYIDPIVIETENSFEIEIDTNFDVRMGYRGAKVPQCIAYIDGLDIDLLIDIRPEALMETIAFTTIEKGTVNCKMGVYYEGSSYRVVPIESESFKKMLSKQNPKNGAKLTVAYSPGGTFERDGREYQYMGLFDVLRHEKLGRFNSTTRSVANPKVHLYYVFRKNGNPHFFKICKTKIKIESNVVVSNSPMPVFTKENFHTQNYVKFADLGWKFPYGNYRVLFFDGGKLELVEK